MAAPTSTLTPRSSFTLLDRSTAVSPDLQREIDDDEEDIHRFGGDDPHEPPVKSPVLAPQLPRPRDPEEIAWDGPNDPDNPQNWTDGRKWFITFVVVVMTVNVTFASSAPSSATFAIKKAFDITSEVSYLLTSTFLLGYVFGPLIWGPGSELVGRRPIFLVAMSAYTVLHLGQALAPNIETLLITRFLGGFFAVAPLVNSGGVMADIWSTENRGLATSLFSASVFLGPVMGPIVAGYIVESSLSWRWVFWVMMIFAGTCTTIVAIGLPETYAPVLLQRKMEARRKSDPDGSAHMYAAHEKQDWTPRGVIHRTLFRPFQMLAGEPILVLVTIYLSLVYGVMYCLFQAFPIIFIQKRGFTIAQDGLVFIGIGLGTSLGAALNVLFSRHYPSLIKTWRGFPPPEERLWGAMLGGCSFVVGIFWLGWTGHYPNVPWYVPAISTILVGMSISLIFISFLSYLVETYLMYSASAFAANTFCRSLVAAAFPLFTVQMFTKLGVNYAATLLGGVGLLLAPSPFLFYRYGARIRASSKFAPCVDLKIKKMLEEEENEKSGEKAV
ncbi:MFS general substrate transporter [Mycena indigotica]|uniref:MFS general substrate transporter n=1 Tax=Mycena indigotica TaxID=2126181 RepID=A0A8H6T1L8_9AGAR|nr:MFS general substrate transporter [Mycena indigotica]KAF7309338.1 MFS general substrate transporter [Mycena indigotica]